MKKKYIAPDLYFESFVLSQSIAAGCSSTGIAIVEMWYADGKQFIISTPSNYKNYECEQEYTGEDYCYWDGDDMNKVFLS
ncbi:MAG: hypothetical protein LUD14_04005 [Clostridiales bacterium]|nr:hypothetical protein [Clostridiales bacterium]